MQIPKTSTLVLLFLGMVPGWLVTGCSSDAISAAGDTPIHLHMVCVSPVDAKTAPCDGSESLALFHIWVQEAISLPHSTFTVWTVESTGQHYRHDYTACVPTHWKAPVWKNKAEFIMRARQAVSGAQHRQPGQDGCHPPEPQAPGIHQLAISHADASLQPDVLEQLGSAQPAPPLHLAVLCDASASTLGVACNATALLHAFDFWLAKGLARPGSSLSVAVVGPSRDTMRTVFDLRVPDRSVGERIAYILGARGQLAQLPSAYFAESASAIVEAIHATVSTLREREGQYALIVFSDLRQLSNEWDFDAAIPKPDTFLAWLKKTHLLPDLRDIPIRGCGLHSHRSPGRGSHTARDTAHLQEVWQATFREAGAQDVKLYTSCDAGFADS